MEKHLIPAASCRACVMIAATTPPGEQRPQLWGGKYHYSVAVLIWGLARGLAQLSLAVLLARLSMEVLAAPSSSVTEGGARRDGERWSHVMQCGGRKLTDTPDGGPGRLVGSERGGSCFQTKRDMLKNNVNWKEGKAGPKGRIC